MIVIIRFNETNRISRRLFYLMEWVISPGIKHPAGHLAITCQLSFVLTVIRKNSTGNQSCVFALEEEGELTPKTGQITLAVIDGSYLSHNIR